MKEKIKRIGLAIFKFALFLLVALAIVGASEKAFDMAEMVIFVLGILSAFILGLLYRKDIFKNGDSE